MFIRRTQTRSTSSGQTYFTHRLVRSHRVSGKVRQQTLLNLGRHFAIPRDDWPLLCRRLDQILSGQLPLLPEASTPLEEEAQRMAQRLLEGEADVTGIAGEASAEDLQAVEVDSVEVTRPRSVGVEQVGCWALEQLGLGELLGELGLNGPMRAAAVGAIVGRLARPGSVRATWGWLGRRSGLGELLDFDYESLSLMQLYRASDALMRHRQAIEAHLFTRAMGLFDLEPTVTLFDLTNTFFEGAASRQPKAQRGHSKDKRSDCRLLTLGLVLDGAGFVRRSKVFAGRVDEHKHAGGDAGGARGAPGSAGGDGAGGGDRGSHRVVEGGRLPLPGGQPPRPSAVRPRTGPDLWRPLPRPGYSSTRRSPTTGGKCVSTAVPRSALTRNGALWSASAGASSRGSADSPRGCLGPGPTPASTRSGRRTGRLKEKSRGVAQHYTIEVLTDESGRKADGP